MKDLTVIILTKNEEDVIVDAIKSVKDWVSEILVIDANSTDSTLELAEKLGAKAIKHPFKDFSDQRNFGILHAKTLWVLYLDADERLTDKFKLEVEDTIQTHQEFSPIGGYFINRKTYYYGKDWHFTDKVQRLFVRERFIEWYGQVHETPKIKGEFGEINEPIIHLTHRNLSQMLVKTNEWSEYEAKLRFDSSHPKLVPWRFIRVMITEFVNSYFKNKGYKNGTYGLIEAMYQAFSIFITYAKLWEIQEKKK
jgi:glycosyltransferase involved in cell wall biosynthesis